MESVHITRKKRDRANLRQRILDAALKIAIEESWEAVTIRKIAEAVEYTTMVVYGHFENKEALLQEISDNGFEQLYLSVQKSVLKEADPRKQLLSLSIANWDFAAKNNQLYSLMFSHQQPSFAAVGEVKLLFKDIFNKLTGKTGQELDNLILNWVCLRQGCIGTLLNVKSGKDKILKGHSTKKLFVEFINRFIDSIASNADS